MDPVDEDSSRRLWESYVAAHPEFIDESPPTERFGDSAGMADDLLDVVRYGPKRATAGLVAEYVHEHESLGAVGDHWIVADGAGIARVVLRLIELRIGRLDSVDAKFAWDEGEGDRSLEWWLDAHRRFFRRSCARIGLALDNPEDLDSLDVVFKRFDLVWPHPSNPGAVSQPPIGPTGGGSRTYPTA